MALSQICNARWLRRLQSALSPPFFLRIFQSWRSGAAHQAVGNWKADVRELGDATYRLDIDWISAA